MSIVDSWRSGVECDSVGTPDSIMGRAVCLSVHPGKMLLMPFVTWYEKRHKGKPFSALLFSIDMLLLGMALALAVTALIVWMTRPISFDDQIQFSATVAPRAIQTGAPSTLVIRYTNNSEETLESPTLSLTYPDDFLLQELSVQDTHLEDGVIDLDPIAPGASGSVRVRGIMYGDVGGEQTFTSTLSFVHGEQREPGVKTSSHAFTPESSLLNLSLALPDRLIAFQDVEGTISYTNPGNVPFPAVSIEPEWPSGFSVSAGSQGLLELPSVEPGASGSIPFAGYLGDVGEEVVFTLLPSFRFDDTRYAQQPLIHTAPVVPPQVETNLSVRASTVRPGANAEYTIAYENTGEFTVRDLQLSLESDSPFATTEPLSDIIPSVEPGASGTLTLSMPLHWSILQSETDVWEALDLSTRVVAVYTLGDGSGQRVTSKSTPLTSPLTTPVVFESFGRYTTTTGDQLGRGPLPPRVGMETKYWVFWHIRGTMNDLTNVSIEGTLGDGVRFTGRQSSYQHGGVVYDPSTNEISWTADSIAPTLSPTSKIVGVAFEVGVTPDFEDVGSTPVLLYDVRLTGTDDRTGAFVSRSGASVTTNLPQDLMAGGRSSVEE